MPLSLLFLVACNLDGPEKPELPRDIDPDRVDAEPVTLARLDGAELSDPCQAALALAPAWIQPDLELAFRRLEADVREDYAALLTNLDDPWLADELAFTIAHTSTEVLADEEFDPALLLENVEMLPVADASLAYVEIVDSGEPGVDADYSTTLRYSFDVAGTTETVELPAEIYYWYVVHPRIEDERPLYIDAWDDCNQRDLECATTSDVGAFWRPFLWDGATETCPEGEYCPVLSEAMAEATTLWSTDGGGVGAVGEIASFMLQSDETLGRWFNFGAGSERSIQPNRIYGLGAGNCGEWADMTTALSRLALIPSQNSVPSSWDHTWNRFYDPYTERWVNWEPVNWWFDHAYGAPYANHVTRGDGAIVMVTADDTESWFTMEVVVTDQGGLPVDGAVVSVYSPWDDSWWWAGEQVTDQTGTARFELTAGQEFAFRVDSEAGDYPSSRRTVASGPSGAEAGALESFAVTTEGSLPTPTPRAAVEVGETNATLSLSAEGLEGRVIGVSEVYDEDSYTIEDAAPPVRWFVTDADGYEAWQAGEETPSYAEGLLGVDTGAALDVSEGRVLVVVNEDALNTAALGTISVDLTGDNETSATWSDTLVLAPGDHRAFELGGGGRTQ